MKNLLKNIKELKARDVVIAFVILVLPFLFYLYKLAPDTTVWEIGWFVIDSGDLESTKFYLWLICTKLLLVFSLTIWFVTCKHWWRYVILVPLIIELFKFSSIYINTGLVIDEIEYLDSLPFTIPIVILIIFISRKINYYSKYLDLNNEMNAEIESLLTELEVKNDKDWVTEEFKNLKKNKSLFSIEDYKKKLLALRQQLSKL
ncbi:hypothetical protein [Lacinutrix himadriensis]|uniref:hypothetical protein n=1 Tax=Lacinutrix himadriensis TaxID=641549 RepID=UPI0006E42706|nr:hypothetical protein [Lacinutrix himadriensis]